MSLKLLVLASGQAGAGRTTLAANLAAQLGCEGVCWLLESLPAQQSELALQLGTQPSSLEAAVRRRGPGLRHLCLPDLGGLNGVLSALEAQDGWAILDGASLSARDLGPALSQGCAVLWVERGDLQGCRRLQQGLRFLASAHVPLSSVRAVWMGSTSALPLPEPVGLQSEVFPLDPRAWERSAQSSLVSQDDPNGAFAKSLRRLIQNLPHPAPALSAQTDQVLPVASPANWPREADALLTKLSEKLRKDLGAQGLSGNGGKQAWEQRFREAAEKALAVEDAPWLHRDLREALLRRLLQDMLGLGPLEDLLADPAISEVMVNRCDQVYVERAGRLTLVDTAFRDEAHLRTVIERIVWPLGRRIDESSPKVDARLPDGSRVNAVIPPLAVQGSCLTIRKFPAKRMNMAELLERGALSPACAAFLHQAVLHKKNILVSGGTGSGKTTLLNALSSSIPEGERIVTIEDSAELKLQQPHVVTLESRPPNLEGEGAISIRDLVVNALRMRPDRIVVGECRGGEALDMLQAMNTGHEGSLTTLHANNTRDALHRLETLCLMAGLDLPLRVVRQQVASAIDLVVQIGRMRDGSRKVLAVAEVTGMEGEVVSTQDLFLYQAVAGGGALHATGLAARFYQQLRQDGEAMDFGVFQEA
jgi:pilus assembly protein CpaF